MNLIYKINWHVWILIILLYSFTSSSSQEESVKGHHQRRILKLTTNVNSKIEKGDDPVSIMKNFNKILIKNKTFLPHPKKSNKLSLKIKYQPFVLPKNYSKLQIPSESYVTAKESGFPSQEFGIFKIGHLVNMTVRIKNINEVNEHDEEITFAADLILQWKDFVIAKDGVSRYNYRSEEIGLEETATLFKTMDAEFLKEIWKPNIFIENLVKVRHPEVMSPPVMVRVNEVTGEIIYSSRSRIQMECEMDFHYYPADTQNCDVLIRSSSYSKDELVLEWDEPFGAFLEDCGGPNFDFKLTSADHYDYDEGYIGTKTRRYSVLRFTIVARRKLSYHMVQTFLPSVFFIIITWLCFLVPSRMVEARIGITMTTLLTLTAMFASVRESTPFVSYVRAIDIWMIACIFFVFLTLFEFTMLLWLRNKKSKLEAKDLSKNKNLIPDKLDEETGTRFGPFAMRQPNTLMMGGQRETTTNNIIEMKTISSEFIEKYAFPIFSISFIIFTICYWCWLLIGSQYLAWSVNHDFNCVDD